MKHRISPMILYGGMATSALALFAVFVLTNMGIYPMGFYMWFIIPLGAICVGVVGGAGYAGMSRLTNYRASRVDLVVVMGISLLTYAASHYVTYWQTLQANNLTTDQVPFITYMQLTTESAEWTSHDNGDSVVVGKFGYLLLLLETVGFCGGATVPLLIVSHGVYCEKCERYMKKDWEAYHSSEKTQSDLRGKKPEKIAIIEAAVNEVLARTFGESEEEQPNESPPSITDFERLKTWRAEMSASPERKSLASVHLVVKRCDRCDQLHALLQLTVTSLDRTPNTTDLASGFIESDSPGETMAE